LKTREERCSGKCVAQNTPFNEDRRRSAAFSINAYSLAYVHAVPCHGCETFPGPFRALRGCLKTDVSGGARSQRKRTEKIERHIYKID
jgi:hypothetical protein